MTCPFTYTPHSVSVSGTTASVDITPPATDPRYNRLVGYLVFAPSLAVLNDATLGVVHNGIELFPKEYPAKLFTAGDQVRPNDKAYILPYQRRGQGKLSFALTHDEAPGVPYTLTITAIYSNEEIPTEQEWKLVTSSMF